MKLNLKMLICFGVHVSYTFDNVLDALRGQGSSCKHEREKGRCKFAVLKKVFSLFSSLPLQAKRKAREKSLNEAKRLAALQKKRVGCFMVFLEHMNGL